MLQYLQMIEELFIDGPVCTVLEVKAMQTAVLPLPKSTEDLSTHCQNYAAILAVESCWLTAVAASASIDKGIGLNDS